jgi:multicomponent Na+:H+ antiporter subunit G
MTETVLGVVALVFLVLGTVSLLIAAWGVLALPDALARQHAATKAGTLAAALITLGAMAAAVDAGSWVRLVVILLFLFATLPVSSHMLARAALQEQNPDASSPDASSPDASNPDASNPDASNDDVPLAGGESSPNARTGTRSAARSSPPTSMS